MNNNSTSLDTEHERTWCPGCPNFAILAAVKQAIGKLEESKKLERKNFVAVTGIGCHGKMYDYLNTSGFYALHGRSLPTMLGIKMANPKLKVVGFVGDGDNYAEGMEHFIHNCRFNSDMTLVIHNNQTFALTTGQVTPISEKTDFRLNPLLLAVDAGATFVARAYALDLPSMTDILVAGLDHHGFSVIEIVLPCLAFHNNKEFLDKKVYKLDGANADYEQATKLAREWDYSNDENDRIPVGIYYKTQRPVFEQQWKDVGGSKPGLESIISKFK